MKCERGFTLAEILVSILIFTIVSLAMITILVTSTNLFRAGEYGRASTDEAVAALGAIDDDLKRMVPARDGGFFLAQLHSYSGTDNGNCVVAFMIAQPELTQVGQQGQGARQLVMYWIERDQATGDDCLVRALAPIAEEYAKQYNKPNIATQLDVVNDVFANPTPPPTVARRCLHFAAWVSTDEAPRNGPDDWAESGSTPLAPTPAGAYFCTEGTTTHPADPFPTAVRFTLALAGGRYAPLGYVIDDQTTTIRIAGISALPSAQGSLMRIGDEWIRYSGYANGVVQVDANGRGALRSTAPGTGHGRNERVMLAQLYSLARVFPH